MLILRPVQGSDADALFPLIYQSPVTDTLVWNGPESLEAYRQGLAGAAEKVANGEKHMFTIVIEDDLHQGPPVPIGSTAIEPEESQPLRADVGLWIGIPYHGKGYGTQTIRWMVDYGFIQLGLEKIEACIYTGNWASRSIFEKNGFILEGTIRKATLKRGQWQDDWRVGLTREDYLATRFQAPLYHITTQAAWQAAQASGCLVPESLSTEGFIHASRREQVLWIANNFYQWQTNLLLLEIDPGRLHPQVRLDKVEHNFFPHIFGALNTNAVVAARSFAPDADGVFRHLP